METEKITRDSKIIIAAKLKKSFDKRWFREILNLVVFLGIISGLYLLSLEFILFESVWTPVIARLFLLLSLMCLPLLIFLKNYFREIEDQQQLRPGGDDFFRSVDLETVLIFCEVDFANPNLEKIFLSLLKTQRVRFIVKELGLTNEVLQKITAGFHASSGREYLSRAIDSAFRLARQENGRIVGTAHLFFGFLDFPSHEPTLLASEISLEDLENVSFWSDSLFRKMENPKTLLQKMKASGSGLGQDWSSGYTLDLNRFSSDITNPAIFGTFSVQGRDSIIRQIENTLSRDTKNNCLLTGPVGSGKTTVVYGLAEKVYWGETLSQLRYKRIVSLDVSALLSGSNREEVAARLVAALNQAARAENVILFIDDIHKLFIEGDDKTGTADVSEVIIPYLTNSAIRVIGVTTDSFYQTYIQPKAQVASAFEKIEVLPTDRNETLKILEDLSLYYGGKYQLSITYSALKAVYDLADRYVTSKHFPAKAVDMLDSICSAARNSQVKILTRDFAEQVTEEMLNIPVREAGEKEKETLLHLEEKLHERVVGQDEAIRVIADAMRVARTKISNSKRPIGNFLFLGPTGVGKTELSKALAWCYFGNEEAMVRMDMNEFQELSSLDRFIGKKMPGLEELEGGEFVKKVREKPFSVILLDEIEKAHPDILNLFLQILDEGYFTDGMGEKVLFSNSIIIATSNAGANLIRAGIQSGESLDLLREKLLESLQRDNIFRPEFLNRFDGVVLFKPLGREELMKIGTLMFERVKQDMSAQGYLLEIETSALERIVALGYKPEFGAREMRRVFRETLEGYLAKKILTNEMRKGENYRVLASDLFKSISR